MNTQGRAWTAAALLFPLAIAAQDRQPTWHQNAVVDGLTESAAFDPVQVLAHDGGYALIGRDRRVYTDSNLTVLRQARNHYPLSSWLRVVALPNDALLQMNQPPEPYCNVNRIGAQGTNDWYSGEFLGGCESVSVDHHGNMFAFDYVGLRATPPDGRTVNFDSTAIESFPGQWTHAAPEGGAYVFVEHDDAPTEIIAIGPKLELRWRRAIDTLSGGWSDVRWAAAGDHLVLAGSDYEDSIVLRIDPDSGDATPIASSRGQLGRYIGYVAVNVDGQVTVQSDDGSGTQRRLRFDPDGSRHEVSAIDFGNCGYFRFTLYGCALTSIGEHTYWIEHDDNGHARLFRVIGDGEPHVIWQSQKPVGSIAFGADGSIVALVADPTGRYTNFDNAPNRQIVRIGPAPTDGITTHAPLAVPGGVEPSVVQFRVLGNGDVLQMSQGHVDYSTSAPSRPQPWSVRRIRADGEVIWQQRFVDDGYYIRFDHSDTQVCARVHGTMAEPNGAGGRLRCLSAADGATTLDRAIDGTVVSYLPTIVTNTPGKVFLQVRANPADSEVPLARLRLLEGDDNAWRDVGQTTLDAVHALAPDGSLAMAYGPSGAVKLLRIDPLGRANLPQSLPVQTQAAHSLAFDASGTLWMIFANNDAFGPRVGRVDDNGRFLDALQPTVFGTRIEQVVATTRGHLIQVGVNSIDFSPVMPPTGAVLIGADGGLRWQYSVSGQERIESMIVAGERAQLLGWKNTTAFLADIDAATGVETRRTELALPFAYSRYGSGLLPNVTQVEPDRVLTAHRKPARVVLGEAGIAPLAALEGIAPALAGAWQLSDLSGQGLVLAYHATNHSLSGAWFSHDSPWGDVSHNTLRWNTLIGQVASGATSVSLTMYQNRGGVFDAGPVTAATVVGQATLTATSCDHATLRYEFADARVPPRSVALTRASPRSTPCRLSFPGTIGGESIAPAYTPRSDLAGAWYEPATSGQGFHIAVYPAPGHAADQPETLGLGWFTYDPAGAADESTQQHWFTASGRFNDLSQANANLTLYRTTGGNRELLSTYNTHAVGTATLTRIDCDSATLSYQFDNSAVASNHAGMSGEIALSRLGGCATP